MYASLEGLSISDSGSVGLRKKRAVMPFYLYTCREKWTCINFNRPTVTFWHINGPATNTGNDRVRGQPIYLTTTLSRGRILIAFNRSLNRAKVHACDRRVSVISAPAPPLNWPAWNRLRWNTTLFNSLSGRIPDMKVLEWLVLAMTGSLKVKAFDVWDQVWSYKFKRFVNYNVHPRVRGRMTDWP